MFQMNTLVELFWVFKFQDHWLETQLEFLVVYFALCLVAEKSEENNEDPEPYFSYSNIERHNLSNFKPSYLVSTCDDSSTERGFRVVEPRINLIWPLLAVWESPDFESSFGYPRT
jgi:hypothetical protein